ncbi:MAG: 1,4-alpha-glucan branching protein GlgB [Oscillospiraceae bacterium]
MELEQFYGGRAFTAYRFFGAHPQKGGVQFCTYAPAARRVCLVGGFNNWQEEEMPRQPGGVFSLLCPAAAPGHLYKYRIYGPGGEAADHADPYGFAMELRPGGASVVASLAAFAFTDGEWMARRTKNYNRPLHIYEVHLGSWKTPGGSPGGWYTYLEIADELIAYALQNYYTHLEFMPLCEHPADSSWGYQNTGFFSPTSRYGSPAGLMELINRCHLAGLGVILDFVPVHFAIDSYGLALYDGTPLYEYPHSDVRHSEWGSYNFLLARGEVASFLQSAANFWLSEYHFDGLRMDAVSRAIYWQGNPERGENAEAIAFLKTMNEGLQTLHPTAMLIAEDSTAYPKVTAPVKYGGLGFDYKWDLGWMNDTLNYFRTPPAERAQHYHKLTFSMAYFYNDLYLLPFSHDEVVHGKATIIQKMWGSYENKFPQARALYLYMAAHPGKKLNFMGNELAHFREWDENRELDWDLLRYPLHSGFLEYIRQLNRLYLTLPALYQNEYDSRGFRWLEVNAPAQSVYIFMRSTVGGAEKQAVVAAFNFSDRAQPAFPVFLEEAATLTELLNTGWQPFGGETPPKPQTLATRPAGQGHKAVLALAPFSGRLFLLAPQPQQTAGHAGAVSL